MSIKSSVVWDALPFLLEGAETTLALSLLGIALGIVVGVLIALALQNGGRVLRGFARVYVSFARGTPLFVQILVVFYFLPAIGLEIPGFWAGVLALSLNSGAYISEMIRGGLTAIRPGQIEAARAVAMPRSLIWRHIILPQVMTLILPPLTVEFVSLVKYSAFLSIIGVIELTRTAQQIVAATFAPIEIWVTVAVIYFLICFSLSMVTRRIEQATAVYRSH